MVSFRLTGAEFDNIESAANAAGFESLSDYLRYLHEQQKQAYEPKAVKEEVLPYGLLEPTLYREMERGKIYHGDSLGLLHKTLEPGSVDLIMTSPPFGLVRKKSYGNEDADQYVQWFRPFAAGMRRVLKRKGSLVIDIGGSWKKCLPTRSLYHFELLITLCRDYGFHLCQEYYWWNPAKLPTPAEWVNIRRIRVKDAVNCIWWLSQTPWPKASNRRVLALYSESMKSLLKNGYKPKLRPSGHDISDKFGKDNGGSVPPNLLALANTESNGVYQEYCRANHLPVHPARFPGRIPEYFIHMLTDKKDWLFMDSGLLTIMGGYNRTFWRAAAEHDPLCFGSSPVPGRQSLSGDRHGPDAALDSSGLMTAPCQPRVQAPPAGIKRRRRGADGANARLPSEHRLEPAPLGFDQIAPLCRRTPKQSGIHKEPKDLVLDPFAGSCVTGEVSESLERNWICIDLDEMYLKGALARFVGVKPQLPKVDPTPYQIYPPCSLNGAADNAPLSKDGGVERPIRKPRQKTLNLQ